MPVDLPAAHPLRLQQQQRGLSLRQLGSITEIPYTRIWAAEHGLRLCGTELQRLAQVLGCKPLDLQLHGSGHEG